ncbi:unnamed protein product [Schistocephalus solidus]|uniref:C2H2-type domain-containing protein n=1 Tax=Schistocephalus solidus TaxID=70667 RepID=A0A183SCY2_SCHSO|nr:unnamed protein product [Schistocephalus solidus]
MRSIPVTNGVKQGCVLTPLLFSLMFSDMLMDAYRDEQPGIRIAYRTDGHLLNSRRTKTGKPARQPMRPLQHQATDWLRWWSNCGGGGRHPTTVTTTAVTTYTTTTTTTTSEWDSLLNCPQCDRIFTSRIGLDGHMRIHRTETGAPVPGAPTHCRDHRLQCPHCPNAFTHRMGLFGQIPIHDSGIHRNAVNTDTPCTPSAPAIHTATATPTTMNDIPPGSPDFSCPHCARNFNSSIGLVTVKTIEKDTGEDLPGDVEQRDASVVITELPVPFPLLEMDDAHVFEILRNFSMAPHLLDECCEFCRQPRPTVLMDFRWDRVGSRAHHWESVGADDGGELVSPKRQAEAHQAIIDTLRQTGQTSHDVVPDGIGNTSVASICPWPTAPEEGVAGINLLQLTLFRESVVNAPVAVSNWYPALTCGSSKLALPSGHTPGNRHDWRAKPGEGLRCCQYQQQLLSQSPNRTLRAARVSPLTLAAWNVRSHLDNRRSNRPERRTALVAQELARYKVEIAVLSETRFSEQGQLEEVGAGYTFFWSGRATRRWCRLCHLERHRETSALPTAGYQ